MEAAGQSLEEVTGRGNCLQEMDDGYYHEREKADACDGDEENVVVASEEDEPSRRVVDEAVRPLEVVVVMMTMVVGFERQTALKAASEVHGLAGGAPVDAPAA